MSDRYELGRTYYVPCGDYGPIGQDKERATLREVVDLIDAMDERDARALRCIERREVRPYKGGGSQAVSDSPVASYTLDGRRPYDLARAERVLDEAMRSLHDAKAGMNALGVMPSEAVADSHLSYARRALRKVESARVLIERGIEEALREGKRADALEAARG